MSASVDEVLQYLSENDAQIGTIQTRAADAGGGEADQSKGDFAPNTVPNHANSLQPQPHLPMSRHDFMLERGE